MLKKLCVLSVCTLFFFTSCKKKNIESDIFIKKQWKVELSATQVLPAINGRTDHAVAMVYLMDNQELHYDIYFDKTIENNDTPTGGKLFLGDSGVQGTVFIDLKTPAFDSHGETKGAVTLDAAAASKLQTEKVYLQLSSTQQPSGIVRGQLN